MISTRDDDIQEKKLLRKYSKILLLALIPVSFIATLIPDQKDLAIIFSGYWVTNNKEIQKLPHNVVKTVNDFLEKYQDKNDQK